MIKVLLFLAAVIALVLGASWVFYSCAARGALEREIAETPRDAETGVVVGTEALTLPGSSGKACLLVHGWVGSRKDFSDLGDRLHREGFTVRLMRLPGHGTTPPDLADQEVDDFLDAVRAEFTALKNTHSEVDLVGFSLGGTLSTLLAAEGKGDRLVLVAPFFEVTYRFYYVFSPKIWNRIMSPFVDYMIKGEAFIRVNKPDAKTHLYSYRVIPTRAVRVLCEAAERALDPDLLKRVNCPVLLLHADGDMAASPEAAREAFDLLGSQEKRFILYERSNHHLLSDYDGPEAKEKIEAFLVDREEDPP